MAKTGDVQFTYGGNDYNYMVALGDGKKKWYTQPVYSIPPSLIKGRIDMVIKAAPKMRQADGTVITTRTFATVAAELRILLDAVTDITLDGYDSGTYYVLLSEDIKINQVFDETGRIAEYEIGLTCWDRYQVA